MNKYEGKMDNFEIKSTNENKVSFPNKSKINKKETKKIVEIVNEEELKKIDAYLEWEQEYYMINQSYLLENI